MMRQKGNMSEGHRARLRERFLANELDTFADYEIIEILLTYAIPRIDVKPTAKMLIRNFGNLRGILHADAQALKKIPHIGDSATTFFKLLRDIIPIYHQNELSVGGTEITTISKLIKLFRSRIGSLQTEVLEMVCFDAKLKIIDGGLIRLFEGSVNSANVDIRRIVETAISKGASSIALAHNHPSGDPTPSYEDIRFTQKLSAACRPIDLNFIEHIVVGKNACFSFRRDGHFDSLYDESLAESRLRGNCRVAEGEERVGEDCEDARARADSGDADYSGDTDNPGDSNDSGHSGRRRSGAVLNGGNPPRRPTAPGGGGAKK